MILPAFGFLFTSARAAQPAVPGESPRSAAHGPVILVGMTGTRWADVSVGATPTLWSLGESAAIANLVVRSVRSTTCPADGWLAISAGRRAADMPTDTYGTCRLLRTPTPGDPVPGWQDYLDAAAQGNYDARPGTFGDLLQRDGRTAVGIGPGAAVALATTSGTPAGQITARPLTSDLLSTRMRATLSGTLPGLGGQVPDLVVVDAGDVRDPGRDLVRVPDHPLDGGTSDDDPHANPTRTPTPGPDEEPRTTSLLDRWSRPDRASQVIAADARVRAVLEAVADTAPDATVLVAALADSGTSSELRLLAARGPGFTEAAAVTEGVDAGAEVGPGLLVSRSTRQAGLVQSLDLLPTLLDRLEIEAPVGVSGAVLRTDPGTVGAPGTTERMAGLVDDHRHAQAVRPVAAPFTMALILVNLLLYAAVTIGLNRTVLDRVSSFMERRRSGTGRASPLASRLRQPEPTRALRVLRAAAVTIAGIPIAATLANLVPWWRAGPSALALCATILAVAALIAVAALRGPWRHDLLGPVGVVAGVTALALAVDVATGARLQIANVLGIQPQVGGRFYGFNNSAFALFATASILLATSLAEPLVRAGRRRAAAAVVAVIGVVAVALDGAPSIGADFGGPPAMVPGFLVLALLTLGVRLTWRRLLVVGLATAAVVTSFSVLDWLRPPQERSHLGNFVQTVLDGGLWAVIGRKLGQNVSNFFNTPLTFLAIAGVVLVIVVLTRPLREERNADGSSRASTAYGWLTGGPSLVRMDRSALMLRPGLVAVATTLAIGFALNDSGIAVPAIGIALAVPLLTAVLADWLLRLRAAGTVEDGSVDAGSRPVTRR